MSVRNSYKQLPLQIKASRKKELFLFSFPIALQELSYTVSHWGGTLILVKMSTVGELGLYSAASQWNAIIIFIPSLLSNVILSHLSSCYRNKIQFNQNVIRMLCINFICTIIPFIIVYVLANWISSFYGSTFFSLPSVLRITTFCTIFICGTNVLTSSFIAKGYRWQLLLFRVIRDIFIVLLAILMLYRNKGIDGAQAFAVASLLPTIIYFIGLMLFYKYKIK